MSIPYDPTSLLYAVVEYLKTSNHISDPVATQPEREGQYRLVCLAFAYADAWRVAHLLRALGDGTYWYSVTVAEPASTNGTWPSPEGAIALDPPS